MNRIVEKSLRNTIQWYQKLGEDGAGDKTFSSPVTVKCMITGALNMRIATVSAKSTVATEARSSGETLTPKYRIMFDATVSDIRLGDRVEINGIYFPVLSVDTFTPMKVGEHTLGVLYA